MWATDNISADLAKADQIIKERWGIEVEHLSATRNSEKLTYEKLFYHVPVRKSKNEVLGEGGITGFPHTIGAWCKKLKFGGKW